MIDNFFDKQRVNTGRQNELDIARGLAVLFMIAVHVLRSFSKEIVIYSFGGTIVNALGGPPAAPVFMFILGAGIVYSKKSDSKILLKRGLLIIIAGYLLNLIQGSSSLYWYIISRDTELLNVFINTFLAINILQFAGLALIFFSLCRKFQFNNWIIIMIGNVFIISNLFLLNLKTDHVLFKALSGLFWGSSNVSFYPFLSWIIYPIAGYIYGSFLIRCKNKSKFYLFLIVSSLIFGGILMSSLNIDINSSDIFTYHHQDIFDSIIILFFVFFWIGLIFFLSNGFIGILKTTIVRWSRNVAAIYFIHWVLITCLLSLNLIGMNSLSFLPTIALFFCIVIASDILASVYVRLINIYKSRQST